MSTLTSPRCLRLLRYGSVTVDFLYAGAWRMRVETQDPVAMDGRVFVFRRDPVNPYTGDVRDTFFAVASPADMEEYPPEEPDPHKAFPFFRRSWFELDFRNTSVADEAWEIVVRDVNNLIHSLNRLECLELMVDFTVGPFPDPVPPADYGSISASL